MTIQLPQLLDRRTGITSETTLAGDALDLFLRENPDVIKIGLSTSGDYLHYILLNQDNIDFKSPKTSDVVYNPFLGRLGIGSDDPQATLDVAGDIKFDGNFTNLGISSFFGPVRFYNNVLFDRFEVGVATITKKLDVGIGGTVLTAIASTNPSIVGIASTYYGNIGIGSTLPQQKLDIGGSIKISKNIFDSNNQEGDLGYFLSRDSEGITWIQVNPLQGQGIVAYNEEVVVGAGQSFFAINLKTGDGLGIGTDAVQGFPNPITSNILDLYVYDYWSVGSNGSVYRDTNVGIGNSNPTQKLDVTGSANITQNVTIGSATQSTTKDTGALIIQNGGLGVEGNINLGGSIKVGSATQSTTKDTGALIIENGGLGVEGNINLGGDLKVGVAGTVIITTGIGSVGIGTNLPSKGLDIAKQVLIQKAVYDSNRNVGYKTEFYKTPRTVLGQVAVGATGEVIIDRFFDAANLIRLNLDYIAVEAIGFLTSTDYKSPTAFGLNNANYISCRDDIKDILKAITIDITKGGNSKSVGAGLSYYPNGTLVHITGTDANGYSIQDATVVAITTAAQICKSIINNVPVAGKPIGGAINVTNAVYDNTTGIIIITAAAHNLTPNGVVKLVGLGFTCPSGPGTVIYPNGNSGYKFNVKSVVGLNTFSVNVGTSTLPHTYVSGGIIQKHTNYQNQFTQIKDLTIQDDVSVNSNENFGGCSNVISAIFVTAGIVTAIIAGGPNAAPPLTQPDGKVVWVPPGTDVRNIVWVNKYGNDDNGGRTEGDAKLTVGAAAAVAESGDTIIIRSGVYYENNPVGLRTGVSITGQDLRLVTIVPQNSGKDVFHVRRGCLVENLNFACDTGKANPGGGAVAFPPLDSANFAASGFISPGPATEGPSGRWRSPYIRNCTNFMPLSIGMKINGDHATASTIGADLKSMVCDSFTQYNEAGIGVSITNNGYAQLVSIFTINCDIAIYCDTGGQCDLTNSNSSFGNFGLVAVGLGSTEFTGQVITTTTSESDQIVLKDVTDGILGIGTSSRRPYDGQAIWFKINLSNYNTNQVGVITAPLQRLRNVSIINQGSGYSETTPPDITIFPDPLGPEGIIAEVSATIGDGGSITEIDVIDSGRNYLPNQNIEVRINGVTTNDLVAVMEPIYFTVNAATLPTFTVGIGTTTTVTINEFVPYLLYEGDVVEMRRISRILTSGHSFEYIGTGTDINTSTPLKGAVPIKANEIVFRDGGQVPHTATDQQGNFNIGEGIQINQATATITGRDFSKAIQAEVTPLILALR